MNKYLRTALWVLAIGVVLWLGFRARFSIHVRPPGDSPTASPLVMRDLEGHELSLEQLRGRVVLLNRWASWCPPCRAEIPSLSRIAAELGPRGLVVLGLSAEELPPHRLVEIGDELGIDYPIVRASGPLSGTFAGKNVLPYTWIVDARGRVRASHAGLASGGALRRACERLLDEP